MKQIRNRLTYANVMSSLAVFLVISSGAAYAVVAKKSVGTPQLKSNAVTTAKIKANAVTKKKIKRNAVSTSKIADGAIANAKLSDNAVTSNKIVDGSVTGADINAGSTPFSQIVAKLRNQSTINLQTAGPILLGSYTQAAGEDDIYIGGLDVTFAASCTQPRSATIYLLVDPVNQFAPTVSDISGYATVSDSSTGTVSRRAEFVELAGGAGMKRIGQNTAQNHQMFAYVVGGACGSGTGISGANLGADVQGTK